MREISESIEELERWRKKEDTTLHWRLEAPEMREFFEIAPTQFSAVAILGCKVKKSYGDTPREALHLLCEELKTGGDDER